jgi:hypothetical protein
MPREFFDASFEQDQDDIEVYINGLFLGVVPIEHLSEDMLIELEEGGFKIRDYPY